MTEMDTNVICGSVRARSGDIVFADIDGVVVIPQEDEKKIIERAREKITSENHTRDELRKGRLLVYEKYGVL